MRNRLHWDEVLLRGVRRRATQRSALSLVAAGLVIGLLPGVAFAHFDPAGTRLGGAQLDLPDTAIFAWDTNTTTVRGRYFVPNDKALVFECAAGEADLRNNCVLLGAALTDANGNFSAAIKPVGSFVSPSGNVTHCRVVAGVQCAVAAATYDTALRGATSMADHLICFDGFGFGPGCTTNRDGTPTTSTTTTLIPPIGEWQPGPSMNVARRDLATAVGLDGRMYALGGTSAPMGGRISDDGEPALNSAEVLDPCGRKMWVPIAPMPTARTQFAAATGPDGRIYAIGGRDAVDGIPLATVDAYDPDTNSWSSQGEIARLTVPRADLAAATGPDGLIYAIGGLAGGDVPLQTSGLAGGRAPLQTVEAYDVTTNQWRQVTPSLATHVRDGATTGPDGRIYAIGLGNIDIPFPPAQSPGVNESYSTSSGPIPGPWRAEPAPGFAVTTDGTGHAAVTTGPNGLIYAIGGERATTAEPARRTVWVFDTNSRTWKLDPGALTARRTRLGAAAGRDGRIYAIGGLDYDNLDPNLDPYPALASTESAQVASSACAGPPADFDANRVTDYSVFRPSTGTWFVKDGLTTGWGTQGDIPVPADYDGDLKTDVAVFRPSSGVWFVKDGQTVAYGTEGDIPVPADYDGDDRADIAVFRPSNGVWFIHYSGGGDGAFAWGTEGDVAVPADYDGDNKADAGVFRNGVWFIHPSSGAADITVNYGTAGDIPVVGDYDADHTADLAVFRPSDGVWFLRHSGDGAEETFAWGTSGDIPVPGDYGSPNSPTPDGIADPAVFRPSTGTWFTELGTTANWGVGTDIPLPLPAATWLAYFGGGGG